MNNQVSQNQPQIQPKKFNEIKQAQADFTKKFYAEVGVSALWFVGAYAARTVAISACAVTLPVVGTIGAPAAFCLLMASRTLCSRYVENMRVKGDHNDITLGEGKPYEAVVGAAFGVLAYFVRSGLLFWPSVFLAVVGIGRSLMKLEGVSNVLELPYYWESGKCILRQATKEDFQFNTKKKCIHAIRFKGLLIRDLKLFLYSEQSSKQFKEVFGNDLLEHWNKVSSGTFQEVFGLKKPELLNELTGDNLSQSDNSTKSLGIKLLECWNKLSVAELTLIFGESRFLGLEILSTKQEFKQIFGDNQRDILFSEATGACLDRKTGLLFHIVKETKANNETVINVCFLGLGPDKYSNFQFEEEYTSLENESWDAWEWWNAIANMIGWLSPYRFRASEITAKICDHYKSQNNSEIHVCGESNGGATAQFAALDNGLPATIINALPLGVGAQKYLYDQKKLTEKNIEKITELSIQCDAVSYGRMFMIPDALLLGSFDSGAVAAELWLAFLRIFFDGFVNLFRNSPRNYRGAAYVQRYDGRIGSAHGTLPDWNL